MRGKSKMRNFATVRWTAGASMALAFAATSVFAQGDTTGAAKGAAGKAPAAKATTPEATVGFRRQSQLTAGEQLKQSSVYLKRMRAAKTRVGKLARRARANKDLIKLNCVNDKGIRIKGNLRLAESLETNLKAAAARRDAGARNHEFSKLTITFQKVTVLSQEADACIGDEISYVGKAKVTVDIDPDLVTQGDPTVQPATPLPTTRPPVASPTK